MRSVDTLHGMFTPAGVMHTGIVHTGAHTAVPAGFLMGLVAPHRIAGAAVIGMAFAAHRFAAPLPETGRLVALLVLLVVALAAIRVWTPLGGGFSRVKRIMTLCVALVAGGGAVAGLAASGSWAAAAILASVFVSESVFFLPPLSAAKRLPVEAGLVVSEGVLLPAFGYAAVASGWTTASAWTMVAPWTVPWSIVAVTVLAAAGSTCAAFVQEPMADSLGLPALRSVLPPIIVAIGALLAVSSAIALVLAGRGPHLEPELALLATPVAIMPAFFGWLALADPRPEWRYRRVEYLVTATMFALYGGLSVVMLVA